MYKSECQLINLDLTKILLNFLRYSSFNFKIPRNANFTIRIRAKEVVSIVGPPYPWVPHPRTQPTVADTEGQLYYTILHRGLEHPWILVSKGVLELIPCGYQGTTVLHSDHSKDW